MKKYAVFWLAGLLILAFSSKGYAQAPKLDFKASGMLDVQTFWDVNVPPRNTSAGIYASTSPNINAFTKAPLPLNLPASALNRPVAYWDQRFRIWITGATGKELSGTLYFEIDASPWGGASNLTAISREANNMAAWNADRGAVEVAGAYMDVGLPYFGIPAPMTMRIGVQPLAIRPIMVVYSDGAGITGGIKLDPVLIKPYYFKALEGAVQTADDVDIYGLEATAKVGTFSIGGYGLYYNMNSYPFQVSQPNATSVAAFGTSLSPQVQGTQQAKMWWLGVYTDGKLGPVDLNFDFVYDYGRVVSKGNFDVPNVKYSGWASRLKIDYPLEQFNFGVTGMYASGADANRTSSSGQVGSLTATGELSHRVGSYVVPVGSEQDTANNESIVVYGMDNGASGGIGIAKNANYNQLSRGGFGGTWFAKLYSSYKVTRAYKVTVQGLYIGDTTKHGNTLGNAVQPGTTLARDDKDIGFELDLINEFQIYNNLKFTLGGGYLFAGDALDLRQGTLKDNFSPKNPWAVRTRLMYTF